MVSTFHTLSLERLHLLPGMMLVETYSARHVSLANSRSTDTIERSKQAQTTFPNHTTLAMNIQLLPVTKFRKLVCKIITLYDKLARLLYAKRQELEKLLIKVTQLFEYHLQCVNCQNGVLHCNIILHMFIPVLPHSHEMSGLQKLIHNIQRGDGTDDMKELHAPPFRSPVSGQSTGLMLTNRHSKTIPTPTISLSICYTMLNII